jgi:hypothetical protein
VSSELVGVLVLGLGCAANPWGIMIAVLLLDARRGHGIVWAYVVAWTGAIAVVLAVLLAGFGSGLGTGSAGATTAASLIELLLGLTLLAFAARRIWASRARPSAMPAGAPPEPPELPRWLRAIENISYLGAFLLGIYSATYPLVIAAAAEILRADVDTAATAALAALFVVLGSSSVAAVAALGTFAPRRSGAHLERLRAWLAVHNRAVITAILLVLGLALTVRGAAGLA